MRRQINWDKILPILAVFISLGLYASTLAPSVLTGDHSEFQFVLAELDIPHPTGYPLYVILGHLWSLIPLGSAAVKTNAFSAVIGAATVGMLYLALRQFTQNKALAFSAALFFAVSHTFWSQAIITSSYPLNAFFFTLLLLLVVLYSQAKASLEHLAFLYGLSLTHHRTMLLAAPGLVYIIWRFEPRPWRVKKILRSAALFSAPLLLYLFIPLRAGQLGRDELTNLEGFLDHILGRAFSDRLFAGGWAGFTSQLDLWWASQGDEITVVGIVLALGGLVILLRRRSSLAVFTSLTLLTYLAFNLNYAISNIQAYFIPVHIMMVVLATVFLDWGIECLQSWLSGSKLELLPAPLVPALILVTVIILVTRRYPAEDMSRFYEFEDLWLDAMALELPADSVIFTDWEKHTSLVYYQRVEGLRPDLQPRILTEAGVAEALVEKQAIYAAEPPGNYQQYRLSMAGPLYLLSTNGLEPVDIPSKLTNPIRFGDALELLGYRFNYLRRDALGNDRYSLDLYWSKAQDGAKQQAVSVRLLNDQGLWIQKDQQPVNGLYPMERWQPGEVVVDSYLFQISPEQQGSSDRAELQLVVYDPVNLQPALVSETGDTSLSLVMISLRPR